MLLKCEGKYCTDVLACKWSIRFIMRAQISGLFFFASNILELSCGIRASNMNISRLSPQNCNTAEKCFRSLQISDVKLHVPSSRILTFLKYLILTPQSQHCLRQCRFTFNKCLQPAGGPPRLRTVGCTWAGCSLGRGRGRWPCPPWCSTPGTAGRWACRGPSLEPTQSAAFVIIMDVLIDS